VKFLIAFQLGKDISLGTRSSTFFASKNISIKTLDRRSGLIVAEAQTIAPCIAAARWT
jgi:hypothetical protein